MYSDQSRSQNWYVGELVERKHNKRKSEKTPTKQVFDRNYNGVGEEFKVIQ